MEIKFKKTKVTTFNPSALDYNFENFGPEIHEFLGLFIE